MSDSIATRVDALTADGYRIVKFLNYDDGDFSKIILKVESHFDEFDFKLMENVTHLPFGGGRSFTLVGVKVKEGNDQSAWQMNNFLPGQQVNLGKLFNCEPIAGFDESIQNSSSPFMKHCPVDGGSTMAAASICFNKIHNTTQSAEVSYELMKQIKRACKQDVKSKAVGDAGKWLDVRYNRTSGYTLYVLGEHFPMLMLAVKKFAVKGLRIDGKYGAICRMSCDAAKTHYNKMVKSGSGEESKAVMFGLPLTTTEKEVESAVLSKKLLLIHSVPRTRSESRCLIGN